MTLRRVDRFEILETLDAAGPVEVHLAQERETGRRVILETVAPEAFPSRRRWETWLNQVRALRSLRHPALLAVLDADRNGCFYVAREWAPGQTLEMLLEAGWSFDTLQVVEIGAAVAEALAYLHRNGRVHGAVSPRHVVLGTEGEVRLGGLGALLTRAVPEEYVAPEVRAGAAPGRAADLYGLGMLLRHLYARCEPWEIRSAASGGRVEGGSETAALPDPLAALIHTLTAEDPSRRCRSAGLVAETLRAMARRARQRGGTRLEPDPADGEIIDLSPEFLLAVPHYVAGPAPRERATPANGAARGAAPTRRREAGGRRGERRGFRNRWAWLVGGSVGVAALALALGVAAWPLRGAAKADTRAAPSRPAAKDVSSAAPAPSGGARPWPRAARERPAPLGAGALRTRPAGEG